MPFQHSNVSHVCVRLVNFRFHDSVMVCLHHRDVEATRRGRRRRRRRQLLQRTLNLKT
jgi:hypothetical protein